MRVTRRMGFGGATALLVAIALAGCAGSTPTPVVIVVTPAPTPSPIVIYVTPEPTATPTATPKATTPEATATAEVTPTAAAAATATSSAAMCSGNDTNKAFFAEAAAKLSFAVYCAVLPSGWWVQSGKYTLPDGGRLELLYKNSAGATIWIAEGNVCPAKCATVGTNLGPVAFGDRAGYLLDVSGSYLVQVGDLYQPDYLLSAQDVSKANVIAWAAALQRVPRS